MCHTLKSWQRQLVVITSRNLPAVRTLCLAACSHCAALPIPSTQGRSACCSRGLASQLAGTRKPAGPIFCTCLQVPKPHRIGRLFTLFLTFPAMAVCFINEVLEPEPELLNNIDVSAWCGNLLFAVKQHCSVYALQLSIQLSIYNNGTHKLRLLPVKGVALMSAAVHQLCG